MFKQLALATTLLTAVSLADAQQRPANYDWYLDPMIMYSVADSDRGTAIEDGAGGRIIFGRKLSTRLAIELGFVGDQLKNTGGTNISRSGATVDLRYTLGKGGLKPFALIGAGAVSVDSGAATKETETVVNAGLGILWQFNNSGTSLRSEVRARSIEDTATNKDFIDYDIGLGVHIPLDSDGGVAAVVPLDTTKLNNQDSDGDGVMDANDSCPRSPVGATVDSDGCPIADVMPLRGLVFARNSAELTLAGSDLERALLTLKQYPDLRVLVAGHTDSRSTEQYNQQLSQRRASSVKAWLVARGINAQRMEIAGYGESRPIADNSTEEGRAMNRRVEIRILR